MILKVDGFLEPSNGPNYFPFNPNVRYVMSVDNNRDGKPDIRFEFRFNNNLRQKIIRDASFCVSQGVGVTTKERCDVAPRRTVRMLP